MKMTAALQTCIQGYLSVFKIDEIVFKINVVATGMPAVITYTVPPNSVLCDGIPIVEACRRLEENGADVVGLNCGRGPATMIPLLKEIKKVCKVMLFYFIFKFL